MKKFSQSSEKYVKKYPNYEFYYKLATQKYDDINEIDRRIVYHIINWRKYNSQKYWKFFYDDLEYDHAFIQWIFPNFFKSMFNYNSCRLNIDELIKMKESPEIIAILKENTQMIEKFLGIYEDQHNRFNDCVVRDTHNRLRIRRILACLKVFDLKEECDNFLNTMIDKLQQEKQPKRFEYVIQLFKQYDNIISEKNINLYFQEDIIYDKEDKDKIFNHFNFMNVEQPLAQLDNQEHDNQNQNSKEPSQQQQIKDEIKVENNQISQRVQQKVDPNQYTNKMELQYQNIKQEENIVIKQNEQNFSQIKKDKSVSMVQPKQVGQNDDFPFEEEECEQKEGNQPQKKQENNLDNLVIQNNEDNKDNKDIMHNKDNQNNQINPQIQIEPKPQQQIDVEPKL